MNYNKLFDENPDTEFFYNAPGYRGNKMVVGMVSLKNAIARLDKDEFYTLVTYKEGQELPKQYKNVLLDSQDDTLFASYNPDEVRVSYICEDGGIQTVSRLADNEKGANYLLGPGPDEVSLNDLVIREYNKYLDNQENKHVM